jgi:hypothetical protein
MIFAIAGSTSANENNSRARVTRTALPYSARVMVVNVGVVRATASGSVVQSEYLLLNLGQHSAVALRLSQDCLSSGAFVCD